MSFNHLDSLYAPLDVSEKIPAGLIPHRITASSVVKDRRTARFQPLGQGNFSYTTNATATGLNNSTNIISFRVTDSQSYLDLQSMYLNFNIQLVEGFGASTRINTPQMVAVAGVGVATAGAVNGQEYSVLEDGAWVMFNRGRLLCNSVLVEDIAQLNTLTTALLYANSNQDVYNKMLGSMALAWKFNTDLLDSGLSTGGYSKTGVAERRSIIGKMNHVPLAVDTGIVMGNTLSVSLPLSLFFDLNRESKYFPLRNCGTGLQYELYVDDIRNFVVAGFRTTGVVCDVGINLSNMYISADLLTLDSAFVTAMDRICATPELGAGYKLPINTFLVSDSQLSSGGTVAGHAQKQVIFSKSTPQLRSALFWKRDPTEANSLANYYVTNFYRYDQGSPTASLGNQLRLGSDLFPQGSPLYTVSELQRELIKMYGGFSMLSQNMLTLQNYCQGYGADVPASNVGSNNAFLWGINFDRCVGLDQVHLDGYDSSATAVMAVTISDASVANRSLTSAIQYTRYLVFEQGQIQMVGM